MPSFCNIPIPFIYREPAFLNSWEQSQWTSARSDSALIWPPSSGRFTENWRAPTQNKVNHPFFFVLFFFHSYLKGALTYVIVIRPDNEEPGSGVDRADEETDGPGDFLAGFLGGAEAVRSEAGCAQATTSHAGKATRFFIFFSLAGMRFYFTFHKNKKWHSNVVLHFQGMSPSNTNVTHFNYWTISCH